MTNRLTIKSPSKLPRANGLEVNLEYFHEGVATLNNLAWSGVDIMRIRSKL